MSEPNADEPTVLLPYPPPNPTAGPIRRHRWLLVGAAVVAVAIIGGVALAVGWPSAPGAPAAAGAPSASPRASAPSRAGGHGGRGGIMSASGSTRTVRGEADRTV